MKKIIFSIVTIILTSHTVSVAQEEDKNFLFLGATAGANDYVDSNATVGVEGLYMRKVWGAFAVGGGANYNFGIPNSGNEYERGSYEFNGITYPKSLSERTDFFHGYGVSLLLGAVFDHKSGARTAIIFGPQYGEISKTEKFTLTYIGDNLADQFSDPRIDKFTDREEHLSLRLGAYHKIKNSNWTIGVNINYGAISQNSDVGGFTHIKASVGYTF